MKYKIVSQLVLSIPIHLLKYFYPALLHKHSGQDNGNIVLQLANQI